MSYIPSYYHLSQPQIRDLTFHVNLRCVRNGGDSTDANTNNEIVEDNDGGDTNRCLISKEISWQEKIPGPCDVGLPSDLEECASKGRSEYVATKDGSISIFTYTNADVSPSGALSARSNNDDLQNQLCLRHSLNSRCIRNTSVPKSQNHNELRDRVSREDPCQIMVIMAAIGADSPRSFQEEVLCVVKVFQSGMVSACPGWSEEEAEDYDDNRIFASDRGIAEMMNKGPRLTTYKFTTSAGSLYEYTIEPVGDTCFSDDTEQLIAEQNDLFREIDEKRRELIRKEFEPMLCLFDTSDSWDHQAHIEIVSADGFSEPNLLLCAPFGTKIMIRFKVYSCDCSGKEGIVSKGVTNSVQNNPSTPCSLEFVTFFNLAFIVIAFALLLSMENNENDFSRILALTSVPIVLIIGSTVVCNESIYHFNHQFSLLYNLKHKKSSSLKEGKNYEDMVLELHAYYTHNFGAISLAGCGALTLPSKPGKYDIEVPTWKPISCSNMGEIRGRMQHYYLGSCLEEIRPSDPVPTSERESDWVKGTNLNLLSKGGLQTDGSGSIMVRVDVMENYFNKRKGADMTVSEEEESYQHRVRMRETVDEVLTRVRQNKRERMVRVRDSVNDANSKGITKSVGWRREENTPSTEGTGASNNCGSEILAGRTAEVLERVKSRNSSSNTGQDTHL